MRSENLRRAASTVTAICIAGLAIAGCGQPTGPSGDASTATEADRAAAFLQTTITSAPNSTAAVESESGERHYELGVDELAFAAGEFPTDDPLVTVPNSDSSTDSASSTDSERAQGGDSEEGSEIGGGGGGAPVTTAAAPAAADVSIYQGIIGTIELDRLITPPVADPPTVAAGILPLTGLAGTVPGRPAAMVKIDNGSRARPQSGLNAADIVVEEEVEGGITRFAAIFHSTSSIVGPIRSGRTTDIGVMNSLGSPLLLYSGANGVTDALIRAQPTIQNRSASTSSGYWRNSSRRAPSNLYSDTAAHWASATGGPPPPQFAYRPQGAPVGGTDASALTVAYRGSAAGWSWNGSSWLRSQGGKAHNTASGERVSAANVVVIEANEVATGMVDSSGATVPEFVFVGTGRATVFTAGKRIEGIWTKPTLRSVATLTTTDGGVIELTPGRTWIQLIGAGSGLLR